MFDHSKDKACPFWYKHNTTQSHFPLPQPSSIAVEGPFVCQLDPRNAKGLESQKTSSPSPWIVFK